MITLIETFTVSVNSLPYYYQFSANGLNCINFSNPSGSSSNPNLTTVIVADSTACLNGAVISLDVTDNNGCTERLSFTLVDPCNDFQVTNISQNSGLKFSILGSSPTCNGLNFTWNYDETAFDRIGTNSTNFTSNIQLAVKPGVIPPTDNVLTVEITNCKGCRITKSINFSLCVPVAQNINRALTCVPTPGSPGNYTHTGTITLPDPVGCASSTKWATLQITNNTGLTVVSNNNILTVTGAQSIAPGTYTMYYTVEDEFGVNSTTGEIKIIKGLGCAESDGASGVGLQNITQEVNFSGASPGNIIQIPLINYVTKNKSKNINWNSFSLNSTPAPIASSINLKALVTGEQYIEYVVPSPVPASDSFSWTVQDEDGLWASSSYVSLVENANNPITVADTACVVMGNSVNINVLANDTLDKPVNPSGVNIVTPPSFANASVNSDGTINFSAPVDVKVLGGNVFSYKVTDVDGNVSNTSNVTVTVISAGEGTINSLCYPYSVTAAIFAPINFINQPRTSGGV